MTTEKGERTTNQEDLDSTLAFLKEIAPGCDFIAVNFNTRLKNRQAEVPRACLAKPATGPGEIRILPSIKPLPNAIERDCDISRKLKLTRWTA